MLTEHERAYHAEYLSRAAIHRRNLAAAMREPIAQSVDRRVRERANHATAMLLAQCYRSYPFTTPLP